MKNLLIVILIVFSGCKEIENREDFHFVYLNWASPDTSSTMQINIASSKDKKKWMLHLREEGKPTFIGYSLEAKSNRYLKKAFYLHHELTALKETKSYDFFITADDYIGPIYSFKTIAKDTRNLKFISGGDTGVGPRFQKMAELAQSMDFDLAIFGGDIAYADGDVKNYKEWIKWLHIWTEASNKSGRLIPFIVAIGNHEINYLNYFGTRFDRAPFYFYLFNQDYNTYFSRQIAGQKFIILDTGHIASYKSQKDFIRQELDTKDETFKFAFYHIPFFPAHREFGGQAAKGRKAWMSIFEDKNLDIAFEHHDHVLKRTYPLRELEINPEKGIVYLGDGAMGKSTRPLNHEWYLEKSSSENHFWYVEMGRFRADFRAIGSEAQTLDQFFISK